MAVNNYTWNDPSLWVKNSSFSETSPEGKAYSSMVSNGSGNRIALTAPLPLPASTFTVYAASGFQISLLYFKQDDAYLGPTNGKPLVWQTAESGRTLTKPANAEKFAVFLRRGTGSTALLPADVAEAGFYVQYEYELVGSAIIDLTTVVDVASCTRYYLLQSSTLSPPAKPATKPPTGSWNDTEPTYTSGSTNSLYFCDLTVFSDGTWSYSSVSRSSSYEAAKEAYNRAVSAGNTASAAQTAAEQAQESADTNTRSIQRLDQNVSGLSTQFNVFSSGIEATIEDHSEILSAMSFSTEGLKVQMAGSIYYTLTDDVGYHIYQNDKEIAAFSEGKGSMEQLQMGSIICRKTSKGGWVWTEGT